MDTIVTAPAAFDSFTDYYQNNLAHFPQKHRSGGSFEISMIQVEQPAIELIDPPINQLSVVGILSNGSHAEFDIGDGWTEKNRSERVALVSSQQIKFVDLESISRQFFLLHLPLLEKLLNFLIGRASIQIRFYIFTIICLFLRAH